MMRVALAGIVVIALALGVSFMREELETRHEVMPPGSRLVVDATAQVRGSPAHAEALARGLVSACLVETAPGFDLTSFEWGQHEQFRFTTRPSLDDPDRRQLRGCLEDLRIPRLLVSIDHMNTVLPDA
jgi:hypothetical protein